MSATLPDELYLEKQVQDIRHSIAESDKFAAEQRKLTAEAAKLDQDRRLAPWVISTSLFSALLAGVLVAVLSHFWH